MGFAGRLHCFRELTDALSENTDPRGRGALLALLDEVFEGRLAARYETTDPLARAIAGAVREDKATWVRLRSVCGRARSVQQLEFLCSILSEIGGDDAAAALCDMLRDDLGVLPCMERLIQRVAQSHVPSGRGGGYYIEPREATALRKSLLRIALGDGTRRASALELLAAIADCRLEYGLATGEPRHPDITLLEHCQIPWPLLS